MLYTKKQLERMASPISQSEEEKCKHAISMVRDALKKINYLDDGREIQSVFKESYSYSLEMRKYNSSRRIKLLVQGSYANKTNIPSESDVDVAVILESTFTSKYREGVSREDYKFLPGTEKVSELKDEIEEALKDYFGADAVERHNICINVAGNTYRVDADVVAAYRYRDYSNDYKFDPSNHIPGIEIRPDKGRFIINFPEEHIKQGIIKNKESRYVYKKCVRIIKSIKEDMEEEGWTISEEISSFGLESLLWNVDNSVYTKFTSILGFAFEEVIQSLKSDFLNFKYYKEANGIKTLFKDKSMLLAYKKFITDVCDYYEYAYE